MTAQTPASRLRLLAVMEATTVTGAAKSMLDFCRAARDFQRTLSDLPTVETSIITFDRARGGSEGATSHQQPHHQSDGNGGQGLPDAPNEFVAAARAVGVEVDIVEERFRFDLRVIPRLRQIIEERRPDIVLTHHVKSHFLMKCSGLRQKYRWVAFHHGYTTTDLKMRAYNRLDRWSLPKADRVITVCDAFAQELERAGVPRRKISVQHNSISAARAPNESEVESLKSKFNLAEGERLILAIGRLSREKAQIDLVNAFAHLRSDLPEMRARLLIIGDGPERARLEAAADALGVRGQTIFAGQLSDVSSYYALADLMALPSHSEGSPYVLLEAMAAGTPVVATAVGGVPEMVTDEESALLVPARDPRSLAAAIGRVLTDRELARRLATNASALAATRYSPETYLRSMVGIYSDIVRSSARRQDVREG